jgi:hypothetical protein
MRPRQSQRGDWPSCRPGDIPIYGYIHDVRSGKLIEAPAATEAGRAR